MLPILALAPLVSVGGSVLLSWLVTFLIIAAVVLFVVWLASKFLGPPNIPPPWTWILWCIIAIGLVLFIFSAFGVRIP